MEDYAKMYKKIDFSIDLNREESITDFLHEHQIQNIAVLQGTTNNQCSAQSTLNFCWKQYIEKLDAGRDDCVLYIIDTSGKVNVFEGVTVTRTAPAHRILYEPVSLNKIFLLNKLQILYQNRQLSAKPLTEQKSRLIRGLYKENYNKKENESDVFSRLYRIQKNLFSVDLFRELVEYNVACGDVFGLGANLFFTDMVVFLIYVKSRMFNIHIPNTGQTCNELVVIFQKFFRQVLKRLGAPPQPNRDVFFLRDISPKTISFVDQFIQLYTQPMYYSEKRARIPVQHFITYHRRGLEKGYRMLDGWCWGRTDMIDFDCSRGVSRKEFSEYELVANEKGMYITTWLDQKYEYPDRHFYCQLYPNSDFYLDVLNGDDLLWLKYQVEYDNLKNETSLRYAVDNLYGEGGSEPFTIDVLGVNGSIIDSFPWPYTDVMQFSIDLNVYSGITQIRIQRVPSVKNIQVKFYKLE